ncbi:hypothetical protein GCM10023321_70240 [Pseudonocardia eucalypti]|uniref:Uncharacterized protein n=1 Tax=Pseudonocardia eucalypti TaxID=648755 RepID=A0ABP9R4U9_9PSEU
MLAWQVAPARALPSFDAPTWTPPAHWPPRPRVQSLDALPWALPAFAVPVALALQPVDAMHWKPTCAISGDALPLVPARHPALLWQTLFAPARTRLAPTALVLLTACTGQPALLPLSQLPTMLTEVVANRLSFFTVGAVTCVLALARMLAWHTPLQAVFPLPALPERWAPWLARAFAEPVILPVQPASAHTRVEPVSAVPARPGMALPSLSFLVALVRWPESGSTVPLASLLSAQPAPVVAQVTAEREVPGTPLVLPAVLAVVRQPVLPALSQLAEMLTEVATDRSSAGVATWVVTPARMAAVHGPEQAVLPWPALATRWPGWRTWALAAPVTLPVQPVSAQITLEPVSAVPAKPGMAFVADLPTLARWPEPASTVVVASLVTVQPLAPAAQVAALREIPGMPAVLPVVVAVQPRPAHSTNEEDCDQEAGTEAAAGALPALAAWAAVLAACLAAAAALAAACF